MVSLANMEGCFWAHCWTFKWELVKITNVFLWALLFQQILINNLVIIIVFVSIIIPTEYFLEKRTQSWNSVNRCNDLRNKLLLALFLHKIFSEPRPVMHMLHKMGSQKEFYIFSWKYALMAVYCIDLLCPITKTFRDKLFFHFNDSMCTIEPLPLLVSGRLSECSFQSNWMWDSYANGLTQSSSSGWLPWVGEGFGSVDSKETCSPQDALVKKVRATGWPAFFIWRIYQL